MEYDLKKLNEVVNTIRSPLKFNNILALYKEFDNLN